MTIFRSDYPPLYRFLPNKIDRVLDILINKNIYHSSVKNFNDPYELRIRIKHPKDKKELKKYFEEGLLKHIATNKNRESRKTEARVIAESFYNGKRLNDVALRNLATDKLREESNPGICCFSTDKDSLLLWSHYANNHKGCCIEFDFKGTTPIGLIPLKVNYSKDFPEVDLFSKRRDPQDLLNKVVLTKCKEWEYEKEYRSISMRGPGLYKLDDARQIKKILLGAMAEDDFKTKVKESIREMD